MLGQKTGPCLKILCLTKGARFDSNCSSDGVAIAGMASQAERYGTADVFHRIVQYPQLGGVAILEDHLEPSIVIEVGESKAAAILKKVQTHGAGNLRERAVAVVGKHYISCVAVPGRVRSNQFVDGVPPMLVSGRAGSVF